MRISSIFCSSLKNPNYSIGIECYECEFSHKNLQNVFDIHGPGGVPKCAFDNIYGFSKNKWLLEAQNISSNNRCRSCVKANVYLKGNIIFPQYVPPFQAIQSHNFAEYRAPLILRGCHENMDKYDLDEFEVKEYECDEFLCNGSSDGLGNVGLFSLFFLPLTIMFIF